MRQSDIGIGVPTETSVIELSVPSNDIARSLRPGSIVDIAFTPTAVGATGLVLANVTVIGQRVEGTKSDLLIAVPNSQQQAVSDHLGSSQVILLRGA